MKKLVLFFGLLLISGITNAAWFDNEDVHVRVRVALSQTTTQSSSTTILVALSSNTWPHYPYGTRELDISSIRWTLDKVATSTGTLKMGVVTYISGSSSTIAWIWARTLEKNVNNANMEGYENYGDAHIKCRVDPTKNKEGLSVGYLPYALTNDYTEGSVDITSSTVLGSAISAINPTASMTAHVGDIVFSFKNNFQAETASFEITYHSRDD